WVVGTGSRKNRISCDFRFEIGIAALEPRLVDQCPYRVYNYRNKKEWRDADERMVAIYCPSSWWFFSRFGG
ncbi:MAG: hypothetical protein LBT33_08495, partial [Spirochaetia bacterium]|nr:hypothetical protein [Spirochaetia bacterium]